MRSFLEHHLRSFQFPEYIHQYLPQHRQSDIYQHLDFQNHKKQLINYLSRRNFKSQNAFTLVELIVVVVIIGILSSIAIPSFQNASEKAKQKEASSMLASYAKAAQAYYTEYGQLAISPRNLGEYVTVSACRYGTVAQCKSAGNALYNNTNTRANARWYTLRVIIKYI